MEAFNRFRASAEALARPDLVVPITFEAWEDRLLPLLAELEGAGGLTRRWFSFGSQTILFLGNDLRWADLLHLQPCEPAKTADVEFYAFHGLKDLSVLRRFKEFPDETERSQLEEPWMGECVQARALVSVNSVL